MTHYDVAVVGAGPAGSAAALALARRGARVALLEREPLPRYKTCGGGVVRRAAQVAGIDLESVVERRCDVASLYVHDIDRRFSVSQEAIIAMTMRDRLDLLLAEAAARAGAALMAPCRVRELSFAGQRVEVGTERGSLSADLVVAADGALGEVARMAGWPDDRYAIPALEYEITPDEATLARLATEARFDVGTVPGGYAWVFPKASHLSVGVLSMRRGARDLHAHLERYLHVVGITAAHEVKRHGFVIPVRPRSGPLVRSRVVLVGDAAGVAEPVTAEGISHALRSGQLAAEAVVAAGGDEARTRAWYHAALEREIFSDLRVGRLLARLLYGYEGPRRWLFRRYGQRMVENLAATFDGTARYRELPRRALRLFQLPERAPRS